MRVQCCAAPSSPSSAILLHYSHPCLSAVHSSGPMAPLFSRNHPNRFLFFFFLIYWGNIYSLFILLWVMFCLSLLLPPLPPASPQTQVLCNAADEDPVLELEYQLPWESNEKQHEKVTSVVKCPYTLLMRKYKASVDFAELIRNNDLDPDFPSPSEARDWSPYISWNVRKLTCHLAWIKRTICRLRYPQSWSDHAWNG